MSQADLERRLEALAPAGPRPELGDEVRTVVETSLARQGSRLRLVGAAISALGLLGVLFALAGRPRGSDRAAKEGGSPSTQGMAPPAAPQDEEACRVDPQHPPRLLLDLPAEGLDFGDVRQDVEIEREVSFRNTGRGRLCIEKVESGCGCAKAALVGDRRHLEPGEAGVLLVRLDLKGRNGLQRKTVQVHTNDPASPLSFFWVRANVCRGLRTSTRLLNLGRTAPGTPTKAVIRFLAAKTEGPWEIASVKGTREVEGALTDYRWWTEEVPDDDDRVVDLHVEHPAGLCSGTSYQDTLVVTTTHPDRPRLEFPTYLLVADPILALPARATLGLVPSANVARIRLVRGDGGGPFRILGHVFLAEDGTPLADGESGFTARSEEDPVGGSWVEVGYDDGQPRAAGRLQAVLVIQTDLDVMPDVRIECHAVVKR